MSAEFPTLVAVLRQHRVKVQHGRYWVGQCTGCAWTTDQPMGFMTGVLDAHEAHQVAAWREACTIRTVEQLDALPGNTVIRSDIDCIIGDVYVKQPEHRLAASFGPWFCTGYEVPAPSDQVPLPARVIDTPWSPFGPDGLKPDAELHAHGYYRAGALESDSDRRSQ